MKPLDATNVDALIARIAANDDDELRDNLCGSGSESHERFRTAVLAELLRRERERCAAAVDSTAQEWFDNQRDGDAYDGFTSASHAIRALT